MIASVKSLENRLSKENKDLKGICLIKKIDTEEIIKMQDTILLFIDKIETKKSSIFNTQSNLDFNQEKEIIFITKATNLLKVFFHFFSFLNSFIG